MSKPEPPPSGSFIFGGTRMHIVDGKPRAYRPETTRWWTDDLTLQAGIQPKNQPADEHQRTAPMTDSDPRKTVKLLEWSVNADATESVWPHFGAAWGNVFLPGHSREPVFIREGDSLLVEVCFGKQPLAKIIYSVKRHD